MLPANKSTPYGDLNRATLQALGLVVVAFSELEDTVAYTVAILTAGGTADDAVHLLCRRMMFRQLIENLEAFYKLRFSDAYEDLDGLCKRLGRLNARRNDMIHSFWTPSETKKALTRRRPRVGGGHTAFEEIVVGEADLLRLATDIDDTYWVLAEFVAERVILRVPAHY